MDILAAAGLVNHFGRIPENDKIVARPILLRKGTTMLALYGLANVRDERLFRTFQSGNVNFVKPQTGDDNCFNLLAVHQNHVAHTSTSYLPETFLPDFLDFVVWGHEHDCIAEPIKNPHTGFYVLQPGSSVATSLIEGEALPKCVFIMSIKGKKYSLEKIRLMTVRPFIIESVSLQEDTEFGTGASERPAIIEWLTDRVNNMIEKAIREWRARPGNEDKRIMPPLPLVRLKVDYSGGYEMENPRRFSNRFIHKVANVNDVVTFHRKRIMSTSVKRKNGKETGKLDVHNERLDNVKIQSLVESFLEKEDGLQILPENGLGDAVKDFVEKDDRNALKNFIESSLEIQLDHLMSIENLDEESLPTEISKTKKLSTKTASKQIKDREDKAASLKAGGTLYSDEEEENIEEKTLGSATSNGRKATATKAPKARAARTQQPKSISKKLGKSLEDSDMLDDFGEGKSASVPFKRTTRTTRKTPAKSGTRGRPSKQPQPIAVDSDDEILEEPAPVTRQPKQEDDDFEDILEEQDIVRGSTRNKSSTINAMALPADTIVMPTRRTIRPNLPNLTKNPAARTIKGRLSRGVGNSTIGIAKNDVNSRYMGHDSRIDANDPQPNIPAKRKHEENARPWNQNNDEELLFDDDDGFS